MTAKLSLLLLALVNIYSKLAFLLLKLPHLISSSRNIDVWFDLKMSINERISKTSCKALRRLYNIRKAWNFHTIDATKTLVHAFVKSNLDFCSSLLFGHPAHQ